MKKIEKRELRATDMIELKEAQRDHGSGDLYKQPAGSRFTVESLLAELLHHSDNTAYHMLADFVGKEEFSAIIEDTGLDDLFDDQGRVSAKEYARVFRSLYNASFLDIEHSSKLLNVLTQTNFDDFLGYGIPDNVPFAHKWGEHLVNHVFSDGGIVYAPNRPYMLVVMIQGNGSPDEKDKAADIMHDISSRVYQYIIEYKK